MPQLNPETGLKECSKCGEEKGADEYHVDKSRVDGLQYHCRACARKRQVARYSKLKSRGLGPKGGEKVCNACRKTLPTSEFPRNSCNEDGLQSYCKSCRGARRRHISTGWSPEAFEAAWEGQNGQCRICCVKMEKSGRGATSVTADHSHAQDRPRALLCSNCNKALGLLADIPEIAERVVTFLRYHDPNHPEAQRLPILPESLRTPTDTDD